MNCAECREVLVAYFEKLLEEAQERVTEEHLKDCEACRAELKELQTLRHALVQSARATAEADLEERVMNRIIQEQSERLQSAEQAGMGLRLRRLIMRSSVVKIAVAAAIAVVVMGAWSLWSGTQTGVALADVLAKVQQVQAFTYKMTMHMKGQAAQGTAGLDADMDGSILIANQQGMRIDVRTVDTKSGQTTEQQMYILPEKKMLLTVVPAMKKYMRMDIDESMFERLRKQNNDPRMLIRQILDCKYTELGKTTLDGVAVEGFETTDPAYAGNSLGAVDVKIWVDAKTSLPVRMDMKVKPNDQTEMEGTLYDFQWEVPVAAEEFDPVLPADYSAGPGDGIKIPAMTEETAVTGLKLCADLAGKYPESLNMMTLMQMTQGLRTSQTPAAQKLREAMEQAKTDEKKAKMLMEPLMSIQMLGGFYGNLTQDKKEPAYYGKVVQPGDKASVLLRWKTGDNEYRVIFGDLHAETVDADTLTTLEAALPQ